MKRIMLAAGPWMMNGTDQAVRVVCYQAKTTELVVHDQTYNQSTGQIAFTQGVYSPLAAIGETMMHWQERNNWLIATAFYASYEFATAANGADLMSQYLKPLPTRAEFEAMNPIGQANTLKQAKIGHGLSLKESAALFLGETPADLHRAQSLLMLLL